MRPVNWKEANGQAVTLDAGAGAPPRGDPRWWADRTQRQGWSGPASIRDVPGHAPVIDLTEKERCDQENDDRRYCQSRRRVGLHGSRVSSNDKPDVPKKRASAGRARSRSNVLPRTRPGSNCSSGKSRFIKSRTSRKISNPPSQGHHHHAPGCENMVSPLNLIVGALSEKRPARYLRSGQPTR